MDKRLVRHYVKRYLGGAAVAVTIAASFYNAAADDLRLQRQLDNSYEEFMLAPENDIDAPVIVNINTATVHHLQRISGIGETRARAVVEYRENHGAFKSVDELANVSGIGEKTLEKIRGQITV